MTIVDNITPMIIVIIMDIVRSSEQEYKKSASVIVPLASFEERSTNIEQHKTNNK